MEAGAEVVVDFTVAEAARANLVFAAEHGLHAVVGTTGFGEADFETIRREFTKSSCLVAANFAIGAVLMMRFAELAAPWFETAEIIELHHDAKIDAPSGTAMRTAERMAASSSDWSDDPTTSHVLDGARGGSGPGGIPIHSVRLHGLFAHQEVLLGTVGPEPHHPPRHLRPHLLHARRPPRGEARPRTPRPHPRPRTPPGSLVRRCLCRARPHPDVTRTDVGRSADPGHRRRAVEGAEGALQAGDAGEGVAAVAADELALDGAVAVPRADAALRVDVGEGEDGAGAADGAGQVDERGVARVQARGDLVRLEEEPLGVAGAVLDAGHRELAEHVDGDARRRHLRVVVREHRDVHRRRDALVVGPRIGDAGGGEDEQRVGTVARGPRDSTTACRADAAPVPASTGTRPSTAERTAIRRSLRSSSSSAAASPVEPATTTASMPGSTRRAAWSAVAGASISPSSSNRVTRATPTPVNGAVPVMAANLTSDSDRYGRSDMAVPPITYVRHAMPAATEGVHPTEWHLDDAAKDARRGWASRLEVGDGVFRLVSSTEPKALETAAAVARRWGGDVLLDDRLREAQRPWIGPGYRAVAHRYLRGELPDGWEPHADVASRMGAAVSDALAGRGGRAGRRRHPRPDPLGPPRRPAGRRLRPRVVLEPAGLPRCVGARRRRHPAPILAAPID